jgi:hypothetical protein
MSPKLWICPQCGRALTIAHQEHSCGRFELASHFLKKDPIGLVALDWMQEVFRHMGPIDIVSMKTMIGFAQGVNVAFIRTKRQGVEISVVLTRPLESARVIAAVPYSKAKTIYRVLVTTEHDLDAELESWLREAYETSAKL